MTDGTGAALTALREVHKQRTEKELRDALSMLCNFIWTRQTRPGDHVWSIPADPDRDFDCILSDAINELLNLRDELARFVGAGDASPDPLTPRERQLITEWADEIEHHLRPPSKHGTHPEYALEYTERRDKLSGLRKLLAVTAVPREADTP